MLSPRHKPSRRRGFIRALVLVALVAASLITVPASAPEAEAQGVELLEVWGVSGGSIDDPKEWKFRQSTSAANDLGSASAAAPSLDDSSWADVSLRWRTFPGPNKANHFRKDFTLEDIGVEYFQIEGIRVSLQYDDTAVMYLNGVEVYRSIRGNLDPDYELYDEGDDIPYNVDIPYGGAENFYVEIPNVNGNNTCEHSGASCGASPYTPGTNPPEIPVSLLNPTGVNTFAVTTWNQSGGGSGDSSLNHTFDLLIDEDAVPPNPIFINEVMASNDSVDLGGDLAGEFPDWFELHNVSDDPVNLDGWTISDNSASWVFPSVVVPANGYLVVAANDENRTDTSPLQTNFKLSKEGDTLKLTNPDGFVADEYGALPPQFEDNAYGRPNDTGEPTYLAAATPGATNSAAGDGYTPILRLFPNRLYNPGESVSHQVVAFDPDGDALTYSMSPKPPGLDIDGTGLITGVLTQPGSYFTTIEVTDSDNDSASQLVQFRVFDAVTNPVPLVLNEYNAVADDREFLAGGPVGNGGDWYEFVVVEDNLDLRGYSIDLFDMKGAGDQLRLASTVTFGNDVRIARAPAGTIITISEENPTDLNFDGQSDWHINFQIENDSSGAFFPSPNPGAVFNSTRSGQMVLIRDAAGNVATPLSGETEAWDDANGGVSGAEVMNLCINPTPGMSLDPVTDYRDNGSVSSFGEPNTCVWPDPNNPTDSITFNQNLSGLRSTATFGAGSGDTNCDLILDVGDALITAQYSVGTRVDSGPCFFDQGGPGFDMDAASADIDDDGLVTVGDALIIARCSVGIDLEWCPE